MQRVSTDGDSVHNFVWQARPQEVGVDALCEIVDGGSCRIDALIRHTREMVFPLTQPESKQLSGSKQARKWMCQRIAQFLGTISALGANTNKLFVQSSRKVNIK